MAELDLDSLELATNQNPNMISSSKNHEKDSFKRIAG
jgi:hypothetical protein